MSDKFSIRLYLFEHDPFIVEVWEDGLIPMELEKRGVSEWAQEHFYECCNNEDLRKRLGIPLTGDYQVFFKGKMEAWKSGPLGEEEWDQDFEVESDLAFAEISEEYASIILGKDETDA